MLASRRDSPGKNIVIIGDGPSALAIAVKLKQIGITHVTLVGMRLGTFIRSGDVVPETFQRISEFIAPLSVKPSSGCHLKDIERQLYAYAQTFSVAFIKMKFVGFTEEGKLSLVSDLATQPAEIIAADIVFDCTGEQRSVINSFNNRLETGARFAITSRPELSNKYFALTRGVFSVQDAQKIILLNSAKEVSSHNDNVSICLNIERLRQMGWQSYCTPLNYINFAHNIFNIKNGLVKANIYTCMPDAIAQEDILPFVKHTVKYIYNSDFTLLKKSEKYPTKPNVTKFALHLRQVTPACYAGDEKFPVIIHAGDASINMPFTLAAGVHEGINRIQDIFDNLTTDNDSIIHVDFSKLNICYASRLNKLNLAIDDFMSSNESRSDQATNLKIANPFMMKPIIIVAILKTKKLSKLVKIILTDNTPYFTLKKVNKNSIKFTQINSTLKITRRLALNLSKP